LSLTTAGLSKGRIEALTDGIFATVMTVLVLSLSIPTITGINFAVESYVSNLGAVVLSYVMSFLLLAVFWVRHHNFFHYIEKVDTAFIWLNILFLLAVGFIPFTTELIGRFPSHLISITLYGLNLAATGFCTQGIWVYATRRKLLIVKDGLMAEGKRAMNAANIRFTGAPILYLVAIMISYLTGNTWIAIAIYVAALVFSVIASSVGYGRIAQKVKESSPGS
jgi:uncharacterized membrane protein